MPRGEFRRENRSILLRQHQAGLETVGMKILSHMAMETDDPFDQSRFNRRISTYVFGEAIVVSRPEDRILAKLRWAKLCGGSEKPFADALRVYELQRPSLDLKYVEDWSRQLSVSAIRARVRGK